MNVDEIIEKMKTGDYQITLAYDDLVKDDIVLHGNITKKGTSGGLDRYEFAFRFKEEKESLLNEIYDIFIET